MNVSAKTRVCALIGDPVEHSLSPAIQNAAFQHSRLNYVYVAFKVEEGNLERAISGIRAMNIYGLNVTMPHKVNVIPFLDQLDESSRKIGSVNTILNKNGKLIGYSTDGTGALNALKQSDVEIRDKKIVILGAGGASRAVSLSLLQETKKLVILNRTLEKAKSFAAELNASLGYTKKVKAKNFDDESLGLELEDADVLINATSIGMHPKENETPVDEKFLNSNMAIFDLVYSPFETRLLHEAKKKGIKTIDGLTMLVHQGADAFKIWTGKKAPVAVMAKVAKQKLKAKETL